MYRRRSLFGVQGVVMYWGGGLRCFSVNGVMNVLPMFFGSNAVTIYCIFFT